MIQRHKITAEKTDNRLMPSFAKVHNIPECEDCMYYALLGGGTGTQKACHYILIEGRSRPCPAGKGCTAKVVGEYPGVWRWLDD